MILVFRNYCSTLYALRNSKLVYKLIRHMCKVSVVLPVYNVAPYIEETIQSIIRQSFNDFEVLVIDDMSTDDTAARVSAIVDPRVRLINNTQNIGRAGSDNIALRHVRGEYIAKMDGDDRCHPERFARQVAYFEQHPEVNVVGGWMQNFGVSTYLNTYPSSPADARVFTLFGLPVGNPTVMLRTRLFSEEGMHYEASLRQTEDFDFFARYIERLVVATLPMAMVEYRTFEPSYKNAVLGERTQAADQVRAALLQRWGIPFSSRELLVHNTIAMLERPLNTITLLEVEAWMTKIEQYNNEKCWFEPATLHRGLARRWFEVCYTHSERRLGSLQVFRRSHFANAVSLSAMQQLKFWLRSLYSFS